MFRWLREWRNEHIVRHSRVTDIEWDEAFQHLPLLQRLSKQEKAKLRRLYPTRFKSLVLEIENYH